MASLSERLDKYLNDLLCTSLEVEFREAEFDPEITTLLKDWTDREYEFEFSQEWISFQQRRISATSQLGSTLIARVRDRVSAVYQRHPSVAGNQESLAGSILDSLARRARMTLHSDDHPLDLINEIIILKFVKRAANRGQKLPPDELFALITERELEAAVEFVSNATAKRLESTFQQEVLQQMVKERSLNEVVAAFAQRPRELVEAVWDTVVAYLREELQSLTAHLQTHGVLSQHG